MEETGVPGGNHPDGRDLTVSAGRLAQSQCPLSQFVLRTSVSRLTYVNKNGLVDTGLQGLHGRQGLSNRLEEDELILFVYIFFLAIANVTAVHNYIELLPLFIIILLPLFIIILIILFFYVIMMANCTNECE